MIAGPENGAYSCGTVALDDFESRKSAIAFWVLQAFLVRRYRHVNSQFALKGLTTYAMNESFWAETPRRNLTRESPSATSIGQA